MFSLSRAVWAWAADSANILLDLANAGRAAKNPFVIAVVVTLAVIRVAALLIFTIPALVWLKNQIWATRERRYRDGWIDETTMRTFIIVLIVASIAFEVWVSPERKAASDADNAAQQTEAGEAP